MIENVPSEKEKLKNEIKLFTNKRRILMLDDVSFNENNKTILFIIV